MITKVKYLLNISHLYYLFYSPIVSLSLFSIRVFMSLQFICMSSVSNKDIYHLNINFKHLLYEFKNDFITFSLDNYDFNILPTVKNLVFTSYLFKQPTWLSAPESSFLVVSGTFVPTLKKKVKTSDEKTTQYWRKTVGESEKTGILNQSLHVLAI